MKKLIIFPIILMFLWDLNVLEGVASDEMPTITNNVEVRRDKYKRNIEELIKVVWKCKTTTSKPVTGTCRSDSMPCNNGVCIPLRWRCDGKNDCLSGEDEQYCPVKCDSDEFQCVSGGCIKLTQQCDGINNCADADDELNCVSDANKCTKNISCLDVKLYGESINQTVNEIKTDLTGARQDLQGLKEIPKEVAEIVNASCGDISGLQDHYILLQELVQNISHFVEDANKCNGSTSCLDLKKYEIDINQTVYEIKSQINQTHQALQGLNLTPNGMSGVPCEMLAELKNMISALNVTLEGLYAALQGQITNLTLIIDDINDKVKNTTITVNELKLAWQQRETPDYNQTAQTLWMKKMEDLLNKKITGIEEDIKKLHDLINATQQGPLPDPSIGTPTDQTTAGTPITPSIPIAAPTLTVDELTSLAKEINGSILLKLPPQDFDVTTCPKDFELGSTGCYYFSKERGSFPIANRFCERRGTFLAIINDVAEDDFLKTKLMGTDISRRGEILYYTGANDILRENKFIWEGNGEPVTFTNWFHDPFLIPKPDGLYDKNCVIAKYPHRGKVYGWEDKECGYDASQGYPPNWICERNMSSNSTENQTVPGTTEELSLYLKDLNTTIDLISTKYPVNESTSCPIGFINGETGCYVINRSQLPWHEAHYICEDIGGWLADISSLKEREVVKALVTEKVSPSSQWYQCGRSWIGGYRIVEELGLAPLTPDYPTQLNPGKCPLFEEPHGSAYCESAMCSICEAEKWK